MLGEFGIDCARTMREEMKSSVDRMETAAAAQPKQWYIIKLVRLYHIDLCRRVSV